MTKHELEDVVRQNVTLAAGAGPLSGAAIQAIVAAAEEYAQSRIGAIEYRDEGTGEITSLDVREIRARFYGIREPLLAARAALPGRQG